MSECYKALNTPIPTPAQRAVRSAVALTCWRLGCRGAVWDWKWGHLVEQLSEDWVVEYLLKGVWELGWEWKWVGAEGGAARGDPLCSSRWLGKTGNSLWEGELGVSYVRGLAALGVVRAEDLKGVEGEWLEWREFSKAWGAQEGLREQWLVCREEAKERVGWGQLQGSALHHAQPAAQSPAIVARRS